MHPDKLRGLNRRQLTALAVKCGHRQEWANQQSEVYLRKLLLDAKEPASEAPEAPVIRPVDPSLPPVVVNVDDAVVARLSDRVTPAVRDAVTSPLMAAARKAAREEAANYARESFVIVRDGETAKVESIGLVHQSFPLLLLHAQADIPVYVYGPSGSGKSHAAEQVANCLATSLGRPFAYHFQSFAESTQLHELIGYRDANGIMHRTPLREAWEHGGVFLMDELDAAPALLVYMNSALSNGWCVFPDGKLRKHADCRIIAAGNTIGLGATSEYTGRQRLDRAVIARFGFVEWNYDEKLELTAAGLDCEKWTRHVQRLRRAHKSLGASAPDLCITPRASIYGARILRMDATVAFDQLEKWYVWQGATDDDIMKVRTAAARL